MPFLRVENKGEIALEALTLMGATSKEGDSSKIGFFGSGNKYALATLLRHGFSVSIFSGPTEYVISTQQVIFRGTAYDKILINDKETSLTTRLGPAWEVWMALRELYANAMDEGEEWDIVVDSIEPAPEGRSYVYIDYRDQVEEFYNNKNLYFNSLTIIDELQTTYGKVMILEGNQGQRYRKGIACINEKSESLFGYDFENIAINESRLIAMDYTQYEQMACALAMTRNEEVIQKYLEKSLNERYIEYKAKWEKMYCTATLSDAWEKVLLSTGKSVISISHASFIHTEDIPLSCIIVPDELCLKIRRELPNVPQYGDFNMESIESTPSEELVEQVEAAVSLILGWGFRIVPIAYRKFVDNNVKARVHEGTIYVSVDISPDKLVPILLEEFVHIKTGLNDLTRSMQIYLFEKLAEACTNLDIELFR